MKKVFLLFVLVLCLKVSAQEVVYLSTEDFLTKVCDVTKGEWNYIGGTPCVIDLYATWCGPCRQLSPIMEELAKEYKGKVVFYKVDIDKEKNIAAVFGIHSIPTLFFCGKGEQPKVAQGFRPKEMLKQVIEKELLKKMKNEN